MFNNKSLKSTLAKVASFIDEINDGISANETKNEELQVTVDAIQAEQGVNTNEIKLGKKLLAKFQ